MKLAVLTYHAMRIHGNDAASNDLVAFSEDLRMLARRGWAVVDLRKAVDAWLSNPAAQRDEVGKVAITCDDGSDFDFHDLMHPTWGPQRGIKNRALEAAAAGLPVHVTSFVITSPTARYHLDRTCMVGRGWWNDSWWREAAGTGLMNIASHSWDHNHETLPDDIALTSARGHFRSINTEALADAELRQAQEYLKRTAPGPGTGLFAYPYGDAPPYLVDDYLPRKGPGIGLVAAFVTEPRAVCANDNRWRLPRFVHGSDWSTPEDLEGLLDKAFS